MEFADDIKVLVERMKIFQLSKDRQSIAESTKGSQNEKSPSKKLIGYRKLFIDLLAQ